MLLYKFIAILCIMCSNITQGHKTKPVLAVNMGAFLMPMADVYSPNKVWIHVMSIDIPCLCNAIPDVSINHLKKISSAPISALNEILDTMTASNVTKLASVIKHPIEALLKRQKALTSNLNSILDLLDYARTESQFIWGLLPYDTCNKCPVMKEEINYMASVEKLRVESLKDMQNYVAAYRSKVVSDRVKADLKKNKISKREITLKDEDEFTRGIIRDSMNRGSYIKRVTDFSVPVVTVDNLGKSYRATNVVISAPINPTREVEEVDVATNSGDGTQFVIKRINDDYRQVPKPDQFTKGHNILTTITEPHRTSLSDRGKYRITICDAEKVPIDGLTWRHNEAQSPDCLVRYLKKEPYNICKEDSGKVSILTGNIRDMSTRTFSNNDMKDEPVTSTTTERASFVNHYHRKRDLHVDGAKSEKWNMFKSWFGLATEEDVNRVTSVLSSLNVGSNKTHVIVSELVSRSESQSALIHNLTRGALDNQKRLETLSADIDANMEIVGRILSKSETSINSLNYTVHMLAVVVQIGLMQDHSADTVESLRVVVEKMVSYYRSVKEMVSAQAINLEVLSGNTIKSILTLLKDNFPHDMSVAPSWQSLTTIGQQFVSIVSEGRNVRVVIRIPLIPVTTSYHTWSIQKVPIKIESIGMMDLEVDYEVIVHDETNKRWAGMTYHQWDLCMKENGRVCSNQLSWIDSDMKTTCSLEMLRDPTGNHTKDICNWQKIPKDRVLPHYDISISQTQWILSVTDSILATESCSDSNVMSMVRTVRYTGVNLITIRKGCSIKIGYKTFQPRLIWGSELTDTVKVPVKIEPWILASDNISVVDVTSFLDNSGSGINVVSATPYNLTGLSKAVKANRFNYADLVEASKIPNKIVVPSWNELITTNISTINEQINQLSNKIITVESSRSYGLPIWSGWLSFSTSTLVIIIGIGLCFKYFVMKRGRAVAGAAVAFSQLPVVKTVRTIIGTNSTTTTRNIIEVTTISPTKQMDTDLVNVELNSTNLTAINVWINKLSHELNSHMWISLHHILGLIIMLTAMIICHHILSNKFNRSILALSSRLRLYPRVSGSAQNVGEIPVILHVLIALKSPLLKKVVSQYEVGLQLTTLPSPAGQWYVKDTSSVSRSLKGRPTYFYQQHIKWIIDWSKLCIKSKAHADLDTCESMPHLVVLHKSAITNQLQDVLPWFWSSFSPIAITSIQIGEVGDLKTIYSYHKAVSVDIETLEY